MNLSFTDLEVVQGDKKVVWEWIGEGNSGDYNENDSEDVPLLRFSCYTNKDKHEQYCDWTEIPNSSYCTRMPINSLKRHLLIASGIILDTLESSNYKRELERLSWFCPADFEKRD